MEIYAQTPERITQTIFYHGELVEADNVVATITDDESGVVDTLVAERGDDGIYFVELITNDYSQQFIHWTYDIGGNTIETIKEPLTVVNPVTTYDHFRSQYPNAHMSDPSGASSYATFRRLEKLARKIIERYCSQVFTREDDVTVTVVGQDSDRLALPRRIINLKDVVSGSDVNGPTYTGFTGHSILNRATWDISDPWTLRLRQRDGARKLSPVYSGRLFKYPTVYRVTGDFGWTSVPQDVYHAADIIIADLLHPDAKYREKMANVVRAADWRMEFAETGMETTGNANADALLGQFRHIAAGVI